MALKTSTVLLASCVVLALSGCSRDRDLESGAPPLLSSPAAPLSPRQLDRARDAAEAFAASYARSIYRPDPRQPPPGATHRVAVALEAAARRVPPSRRGLRSRAVVLGLRPLDRRHISAAVTIDDGRSPSFSVGFTLTLRRGRWLVTQISPPG